MVTVNVFVSYWMEVPRWIALTRYGRCSFSGFGCDVLIVIQIGWTSLQAAAKYGQTECVRLLVNGGANVNTTDKVGSL